MTQFLFKMAPLQTTPQNLRFHFDGLPFGQMTKRAMKFVWFTGIGMAVPPTTLAEGPSSEVEEVKSTPATVLSSSSATPMIYCKSRTIGNTNRAYLRTLTETVPNPRKKSRLRWYVVNSVSSRNTIDMLTK